MTCIGEEEREAVLRTVAAVLHLGNINFVNAADEGAAPRDSSATAALAAVADLLQVLSSIRETMCRTLTYCHLSISAGLFLLES